MPYILNAIYLMISLFMLPLWLYRMATTGEYVDGLWQKMSGAAPRSGNAAPVVWCHAAGVGEVLVLRSLLKRMQAERPNQNIVLSTYCKGGYSVARKTFPDIPIFYAPLDLTWSVRRAFNALQPSLLILSELELWPNLLLEARRRGIPVVVVNSRINDKDFQFFQRIHFLLRAALPAIHWWGAQTDRDAGRISYLLGKSRTCVEVVGSLKYAGAVRQRSNPETQRLRHLLGFATSDIIFVAGSTHSPEEQVSVEVFESLRKNYPLLRLVLVPRNHTRFHTVANLLDKLDSNYIRRSEIHEPLSRSASITLVDSVGELSAIWGLADFAFVGGSLTNKIGGQNMIEPAGFGVATCFGPHVWNFADTAEQLIQANAAIQVGSPQQLLEVLRRWLDCPEQAMETGKRAQQFVGAQSSAVEKTFSAITDALSDRGLQTDEPKTKNQCG